VSSRPTRRPFLKALPLLALLALACADDSITEPDEPILPSDLALRLEVVASGLSSPVYLTAPANDPRLFVVEQPGRIRVVQNGQLLATPFIDLTARIASGGERGLLSVAFDPAYATNGSFYVNYTDRNGDTVVERYHVSSDPNRADPASAKQILFIAQPFANHNGGHQVFGPDGMLYIAMGDGGSGGDPQRNGQNRNSLLGKLLRIDVSRGDPYAIPADNPFVGQAGARGEVWAYGLRNPWRIWFDRTGRVLYVADVGQNQIEEVNAVTQSTAGVNYGWNVMEGGQCYNASSCNQTGLTLPVVTYSHAGGGCSVTGGIVYRGQAIPEIRGHYFYADYCAGWVRSFRLVNGAATDQREWAVGSVGSVTSFGEDATGEMYLLSSNGRVYRFARSAS
jgi:glucose/arabinose dehydrogenase